MKRKKMKKKMERKKTKKEKEDTKCGNDHSRVFCTRKSS
jgi:hypothetical protein